MVKKVAEFDSEKRSINEDETICEYYLDLRDSELSKNSKINLEGSWSRLEDFLKDENESRDETEQIEFSDLSKELVLDFINWWLDRPRVEKESTVETGIRELSAMVTWFNSKNLMGGNPFADAIETDPFGDTSPSGRVDVSDDALRNGISEILEPKVLFIVVMLLKTGLRAAELANLDERDVNLDHPISNSIDDPRTELLGKTDSVYVDSTIDEDDDVNGQLRINSNKENSTRIIPLDSEAKNVLVWYLSLRPVPQSSANPVLTHTGTGPSSPGGRVAAETVRRWVNDWSKENGWYSTDPSGLKPHWCRHWFTTKIRTNLDRELIEVGNEDDYLDYLRGDSSGDSKDDYIQMSWGSNHWIAKGVENSLPELFTSVPESYNNHIENTKRET